ncbi:MAG: hypothetical protein ABIN67_13975 [Ferruginibacter sp.]
MAEILQDYEQRPAGRPTFLTILCILTFIGSGWGVISGVIQYATADTRAHEMSMAKDKANSDLQKSGKDDAGTRFAGKMVNAISNITADDIKKGALLEILGAAICLAGAFMMWNLKKTGYYLYIVGILIGIISPFIIFGASNFVAIMSSAVVGFIGIVFIILYGVNVKHMR